MPMKPASMEQVAPETKASAVYRPMASVRSAATTTMNHTRIEYSFLMKAMAPVWIESAISTIRPLPAGRATTWR